MDDKHKNDNVAFIFDDPHIKKAHSVISVDCPDCPSKTAFVLHAAQQPYYDDPDTDSDAPDDVINVLFIQCQGKRCDLLGLVEQTGRDSFSRIYPAAAAHDNLADPGEAG